jgi:putative membrane protein
MPSAVAIPGWTPQPDVWIVVGLFAALYYVAIVRLGPRYAVPGRPVVTRFQIMCWSIGVFGIWLASDWPIDVIGEQLNFSVHMVQHLMFLVLVAPFLLLGMPAWLMRWVLRNRTVFAVARVLGRFWPALVFYSVVMAFVHIPAVMDASLRIEPVHFGIHALMLGSSLVVWMPVVSPLPEIPRLQPVLCMVYIFAWSVVPLIVSTVLIFSTTPVYTYYEHVQHLYGLSTVDDQRIGGMLMQLPAGLLLWLVIAVVFFRWAADEERKNVPRHGLEALDRELTEMGLRR